MKKVALTLEIQLSRRKVGIPLASLTKPHFVPVLSQALYSQCLMS